MITSELREKFIYRVVKCFFMSENPSERRNLNDFMICVGLEHGSRKG